MRRAINVGAKAPTLGTIDVGGRDQIPTGTGQVSTRQWGSAPPALWILFARFPSPYGLG